MERVIVGFTGRAGAGKDTAADVIMATAYGNWKRYSFAGPLKDASSILFNFTHEQLYDPKEKEVIDDRWGKSPRQILQWLGTDVLRAHITEDFFTEHMKQRIEKTEKSIVITDIRFDNEAELVKSMGGIVIKIERSEAEGSGTKHSEHATEKGISEQLIDFTVNNDGTIEEFYNKVLDIQSNNFAKT